LADQTVDQEAHKLLIDLLQQAYSGELAAALAYRGHWKSVSLPVEIGGIKQIEEDEWVHRRGVGKMLGHLGFKPRLLLEIKGWIIGRALGVGCQVIGWFLPMYFAGRLESGNTIEYLNAAAYARRLGLADFEQELLHMSAVEKGHEDFFLAAVTGHRMLPLAARVFGWGATTVRPTEYAEEVTAASAQERSANSPRETGRETMPGSDALPGHATARPQSSLPDGSASTEVILEPDNVVLAEIGPDLDLDQNQQALAGVVDSVSGADRDGYAVSGSKN